MIRNANSKRMMGLAVTSAMAAGLLTGCATHPAPRADLSASRAEAAMAKGKPQLAVEHAEAAVLAEPRNASYRAMLASAYLDAGRFASAESTFNDAMKLGDNSTRTALSLALALDGQGKYQQAAALLSDWESQIAPADLGLAYALSAKPDRGIEVLSNAIRAGENTPKMRQNLAYAYALAGRWKEARIMASQDVPANQVGDRMEEWAQMAQPTAWQTRVAALIGAPAGVADAGQPAQLALANNPGVEQLATEATAAASPKTELAAIDKPAAAPQPAAHDELPPVGDAAPQLAVANLSRAEDRRAERFPGGVRFRRPGGRIDRPGDAGCDALRLAAGGADRRRAPRRRAALRQRRQAIGRDAPGPTRQLRQRPGRAPRLGHLRQALPRAFEPPDGDQRSGCRRQALLARVGGGLRPRQQPGDVRPREELGRRLLRLCRGPPAAGRHRHRDAVGVSLSAPDILGTPEGPLPSVGRGFSFAAKKTLSYSVTQNVPYWLRSANRIQS